MVWAIIKIYTSTCAQMDPQQQPKTPKFYSKSKKCDIEKTLGYHPPLVARRLRSCHYLQHTLGTYIFQYQSSNPRVVTPFGLLPDSRMFIECIGILLQSRSFTYVRPTSWKYLLHDCVSNTSVHPLHNFARPWLKSVLLDINYMYLV